MSDPDDRAFVDAAYVLGLVKGRSSLVFDPTAPITRQEAAGLLARLCRYGGGVLPEGAGLGNYGDAGQIAPWAQTDVAAISAIGVLAGAEHSFGPENPYTREQSYLSLLRLFQMETT